MSAPRKSPRRLWLLIAVMMAALICVSVMIGPREILRQFFFVLSSDTEYAPGYSESAFEKIAIGDTEASVRAALGPPLGAYPADPYTEWLYSPDPHPDYPSTGNPDPLFSYTTIRFDELGHFAEAFGQISHGSKPGIFSIQHSASFGDGINTLSLTKADISKLKADRATPSEIEAKFGKPRATFTSSTAMWLHYSRSPSSKNYRLRRIGLDRAGTVCRKRSEIYWD